MRLTAVLRIAAAAALLLLSACVVVPRTVVVRDPECGAPVRQVTLEAVELAGIGGCSNSGCAVLIAVAGVTAAASAVVSGSIAIVSNVGYRLEQGSCPRTQPPGDQPQVPRTAPPKGPSAPSG